MKRLLSVLTVAALILFLFGPACLRAAAKATISPERLEAARAQLAREIEKSKGRLEDYIKLLDRMEKANVLEAAVPYFEARLASDPNDFRAHFGLGETLRRLSKTGKKGVLDTARGHLEKALTAYPNEARVRWSLARVDLVLHDGEAALKALEPLLASDAPFDEEAHWIAAQVLLDEREPIRAEAHLRDILSAHPRNVEARLQLAEILRRAGRYDEAARELGTALRYRRRSPEIYYALGKIYAHQNEPEKAIDMYRRAAKHDPNNAAARYDLANIFLDNDNGRYAILSIRAALAVDGRYEDFIAPLKGASTLDAVEILRKAADSVPNNPDLQVFLGRLYRKLGDREHARERFENAKALDPNHPIARAELAKLLLETQPEAAAEELKAVAESADGTTTDDPTILAPLAEVYRREGNLEAFVQTQGKLLRIGKGSAEQEAALGAALQKLAREARRQDDLDTWKKRLREAETAYKRAIELDPNNGEWKFRLGTVYDDLGMLKALRLYEEAEKLGSNNPRLYYRWGRFLMNFGAGGPGVIKLYDASDAIDYLKKAVALDPKLAGAQYALGIAYKRLNDPAKAASHLEKADALGFMATEGLLFLGPYYTDGKQWAKAIDAFERAMALLPDDVEVLKDYGFLALKHGGPKDREEAIEALRRALDLQPDDPEALMNYGFALHDTGRSEEAIPYLERAAEIEPENEQVLYNFALALDAAKKRTRAIEVWRRLLDLDEEGPYADTARERIAYLSGQ